MKSINILFLATCLFFISCTETDQDEATTSSTDKTSIENPMIKLSYPSSKEVKQIDDYHGTQLDDPYRWLEADTSAEVGNWVKDQNAVTFDYLNKIPFRKKIEERYAELFNYPKLSSPFKAGDYYFFYKNDGLQNQSVIYYQKGLDGEAEVFIDPNALSKDGTVAISLIGFSNDDKYVAYSRQDAGSDWQEIHLMEVATKRKLPDVLKWVKFSGAAWKGNGFYYSRYPAPAKGMELSAANQFHKVYYHKLGDDQNKDKLVYENKSNPKLYHGTSVTEDQKYLFLYVYEGTEGNEIYYKDLDKKESNFKPLIKDFKHKGYIVKHVDGRFLMHTNIDAPKYQLVSLNPEKPSTENWKVIIPEKKDLLQGVNSGAKKLFADYLKDATTRIYQYDYDGSNEKEIKLPGLGSAGGFEGKEDDTILFYTFSSFTYPNTIFKYDPASGKSDMFFKTELKFNPEDFEEKQIFYKSKDGTTVPMFIVHKKGLKLDGNNPTYLYGYGGFNVSLSPYFSTSRLILLENGGVFALPNIRGGGEYGEEWHQAGMLHKKQNVFDDFISAAEYLIKEGYTSPEKLAIAGGSNGGLLVGACMTQRPDLFAVALPAVGVLDMLRYHKFTVGWGWVPEYGSSDEAEHFKNLLSYSPLHNLEEGTKYPSTMITTADHDDRVVPAHSFKFAAQLQKYHKGDNPVIIRIETDAGHGAGKPTSKIIEEQADQWAFIFYNTNSPVKYLDD